MTDRSVGEDLSPEALVAQAALGWLCRPAI
jgi:hypothetical protein